MLTELQKITSQFFDQFRQSEIINTKQLLGNLKLVDMSAHQTEGKF